MKKLTILFLLIASIASAQCTTTCGTTCSLPIITGISIDANNKLWANWERLWPAFGTDCTGGFSVVVNGVPHYPLQGVTWDAGVSGALINDYVVIPNSTVCVKIRNYCQIPWSCSPGTYLESNEICITAPVATLPCLCGNRKYNVTDGTTIKCLNKNRCIDAINNGWTSPCNCN